jgi:hypothetical protein
MSSATVGAMRKLMVQQWVTVDNIAAEVDGGLSFVSGEPFSETTKQAFKASVMRQASSRSSRAYRISVSTLLSTKILDERVLLVEYRPAGPLR